MTRIRILLLCLGLSLALPASGQYRDYYIYGKVVDTSQKPLEGVEIKLRDAATSRSFTLKTNANGEFKFVGLPHGVYTVIYKKDGYAPKQDEWKFEKVQEVMRKTEIPTIILISQERVKEIEGLKEMEAEVKQAKDKIEQRDFEGAIDLCRKVLDRNPKDPNALYLLGIGYSRKGRWAEAVEALTQVTLLIPNFPPAYFELAVNYQRLDDPSRALAAYQKNMELDAANADSAYNAGLILFGSGNIDQALPLFEKALSLRPSDPEFLEMAGRCYINRADYAKAIDSLEKAKAGSTNPEKIKFLEDLIGKLKEQIKK